ncbi:MAG: aminotransferase class I/II-fold pyridoxal phosphate-dependent enzyme [Acidimicrobiales bacterium]
MEAIGRWAVEHGIWVITDEIYEHLYLAMHAAEFHSMPVLVPELADTCLVLNGVAKTYAMTGWRVGWMIGPTDVIKAATNLQSHETSNVANVSQRAAIAALEGGLEDVARFRESLRPSAPPHGQGATAIPGVTVLLEGAFYAFPSFKAILQRLVAGREVRTTLALADLILEEAKVAIVPGEAFSAPGYARLSFALGDDDLGEGIQRIADLLAQ